MRSKKTACHVVVVQLCRWRVMSCVADRICARGPGGCRLPRLWLWHVMSFSRRKSVCLSLQALSRCSGVSCRAGAGEEISPGIGWMAWHVALLASGNEQGEASGDTPCRVPGRVLAQGALPGDRFHDMPCRVHAVGQKRPLRHKTGAGAGVSWQGVIEDLRRAVLCKYHFF